MTKTCPNCNKLPDQNDYYECATKDCEEFGVKYLPGEWYALPRLSFKAEEDRITAMLFNDPV